MTPAKLLRHVEKLDPRGQLTRKLTVELGEKPTWYVHQKQHWEVWLAEYYGPGAYGRKRWVGRDAGYVWRHFQCPPGLLWLAEAAGLPTKLLESAMARALCAGPHQAAQSAAIRSIIPWEEIERALKARTP